MNKWKRTAIFGCATAAILLCLTYYDPGLTTIPSFVDNKFSEPVRISNLDEKISSLELRTGLTIFGDSYSVNSTLLWPFHIESRPMQILAMQGASIDKRYCLKHDLTDDELKEVADDLLQQVAKMNYITDQVVLWFGINDMMTLHHWTASERSKAIRQEHETLFAVVDALLAARVRHILIPLTIDFSQSPGTFMAREANLSVSQEITQSTIMEWNSHITETIADKPQVTTIDFYTLSQEWFTNFPNYGLKYLINLEDPKETAYMWADFLHMTPFVHRTLLAPQFEKALAF